MLEPDHKVADFLVQLVQLVRDINKDVRIVFMAPIMLTALRGAHSKKTRIRHHDEQKSNEMILQTLNKVAFNLGVKVRQQQLQNTSPLCNRGNITVEGKLLTLLRTQAYIHEVITEQQSSYNPYTYFASIRPIFRTDRRGRRINPDNTLEPFCIYGCDTQECKVIYFSDHHLPNRKERLEYDNSLHIKHVVMTRMAAQLVTDQIRLHSDSTLKLVIFEMNDILKRLAESAE